MTKPNLSASARTAVENWIETLKDIFKKQGKNIEEVTDAVVDFSKLDIPGVIKHIKFRDLTTPRANGIGGCHDAAEFAKVRQISVVGNPNYQVAVGKTLDQVEEIVILKDVPHPTVPGVRQIEYKIPAVDGTKNPMVTTGALKGDGAKSFAKTIYDPAIWSDIKLEQSLKEAIQDVANKNNGNILSEFYGSTKDGYVIHGYYRDGKITSFFFE